MRFQIRAIKLLPPVQNENGCSQIARGDSSREFQEVKRSCCGAGDFHGASWLFPLREWHRGYEGEGVAVVKRI